MTKIVTTRAARVSKPHTHRRKIYKFHKWLSVSVGIFLFVWLVSGIVMVLPPLTPIRVPQRKPVLDVRQIVISPRDAIAGLTTVLGEEPKVRAIALGEIAGTQIYKITVARGGPPYLIDAQSGTLFTMTPEMAEQLVRAHVSPHKGNVQQLEHVSRHGIGYPWGPLPVYRIVFESDLSTAYYVSLLQGTIHRSTRWSRFSAVLESLHTFQPLKHVTGQKVAQIGLMLLAGIGGLGTVLTGYYLALPRRRI